MNEHWSHRRPWSTIVQGAVLGVIAMFIVNIFTDDAQLGLAISFVIGGLMAVYNDYVLPYWQKVAKQKFHQGVLNTAETDAKCIKPTPLPHTQDTDLHKPASSNRKGSLPLLSIIDITELEQHISLDKNRFDRLRQYRIKYRYLVSVTLIILMCANCIQNYLHFAGAAPVWEEVFNPAAIIFTLALLLEYNISLIKRRPSPGLFFRNKDAHSKSVTADLKGEQKILFSLKGNPLGMGTGITGRPIVGIITCWFYLMSLSSWLMFAIYLAVSLALRHKWRKKLEQTDGPFSLLELRVFETVKFGDYLELLEGWRYLGVQYRLDGPDTITTHFTNRVKAITGSADDVIIKNDKELSDAISQFSTKIDKFERFPVNAIQCNDATWVNALKYCIEQVDIVVMLLSGFNEKQLGCLTELKLLTNSVSFSKIVLIVDSSTDIPFLSAELYNAWHNRVASSPNQIANQQPYILNIEQLIKYKSQRRNKLVDIKLTLVDFLYSKVKQ